MSRNSASPKSQRKRGIARAQPVVVSPAARTLMICAASRAPDERCSDAAGGSLPHTIVRPPWPSLRQAAHDRQLEIWAPVAYSYNRTNLRDCPRTRVPSAEFHFLHDRHINSRSKQWVFWSTGSGRDEEQSLRGTAGRAFSCVPSRAYRRLDHARRQSPARAAMAALRPAALGRYHPLRRAGVPLGASHRDSCGCSRDLEDAVSIVR